MLFYTHIMYTYNSDKKSQARRKRSKFASLTLRERLHAAIYIYIYSLDAVARMCICTIKFVCVCGFVCASGTIS